jgi:hypothetical protein
MSELVITQPAANVLTISSAAPQFAGLASTSSAITVDVTLTTANQVYDITSVSLTAGTWLVVAQCQFYSSASGVTLYTARMLNASSGAVLSSSSSMHPSQAGAVANANLGCIVTLTATTTLKLQATASVNSRTVRYLSSPGNYDNATCIQAVRISP